MEPVMAALVGGALGALVGFLDAAIVGRFIEQKLRSTADRAASAEAQADYERRIVLFRWIFLVLSVLGFSVGGAAIGWVLA